MLRNINQDSLALYALVKIKSRRPGARPMGYSRREVQRVVAPHMEETTMSRRAERPTVDDEVDLSSRFGHPSSGGGGSRGSPTELLASSSTVNASMAFIMEQPYVSHETSGATRKDGEPVPSPLPPSVFLLGSASGAVRPEACPGGVVLRGEERDRPSGKGEYVELSSCRPRSRPNRGRNRKRVSRKSFQTSPRQVSSRGPGVSC